MIKPAYVLKYKQFINEKGKNAGKPSTRWNLESWKGPEVYHPLVFRLKRPPCTEYITVNKWPDKMTQNKRRAKEGLFAPGGFGISSIYEPSLEHPGRGYGDVKRRDALLIKRNTEAGTMTIYVFPESGLQAESLFHDWVESGELEEPEKGQSAIDNNLSEGTNSVTRGHK